MKKTALILSVVLIIGLFCACGASDSVEDPGFDSVYGAVSAAVGNSEMISANENYIANIFGLGADDYEDCAVMLSNIGTSIDEYGVFKGADADQTKALEKAAKDYLKFRLDAWMEEYLPEEYPKLQNAEVWTVGNYVCYVIADDGVRDAAHTAFGVN